MILKVISLISLSVLIPIFCGILLSGKKNKIADAYIYGWTFMLAVFEVLAVPAVFLECSFRALMWSWMSIVTITALIGAYKNYSFVKRLKVKQWIEATKPQEWLYWGLCCVQIVLVIILFHGDADDSFFIGTANTSIVTNTLFQYDAYTGAKLAAFPLRYVFSPFPIFWAILSELTGIHVAILSHTIMPIVFIMLAYIIVRRISICLFEDINQSTLFCIIIVLLNFFGNYSVFTTSSFLLFRIWQGKAIVANIIIPLLFLWFLQKEERKGTILFMIVLAGCAVSSIGIVLQILLLFAFGLVAFFEKKWLLACKIAISSIPCFLLSFAYIISCGR